jgi:hypothetical protein
MRLVMTDIIRLVVFVVVMLTVWHPAVAQISQDFAKVGTTGMVILELPVTARTAALGDSPTADTSPGADALFNNPAALGFATQRHMLQVGHTQWIVDTNIQTAGYALSLGNYGTVGVSVMRFDLGTMQGTANVGGGGSGSFVLTDEFTAASTAFGLSYARRLTDRFAFGGTVRYATERIAEYYADAVVLDFGMLYHTGFRSLRLSGLLQNFGTESQYIADPFKMPITFRFGSAMEVLGDVGRPGRVTAIIEAIHVNNAPERIHAALEVAPIPALMLRGGYKIGYDEDSWSMGVGLEVPGSSVLGVDFVYGAHGRLGHSMGFSVRGGL